jgi:hypothetical protein
MADNPAADFDPLTKKRMAAAKKLMAKGHTYTMAYTTLVTSAGYAGFFTTWAFTKDLLSPRLVLWSGALITVSLMTFVGFELYRGYHMSRSLWRLASLAEAEDEETFQRRAAENFKANQGMNVRMQRTWTWCWWGSVVTGLAAGLLLLAAFVMSLHWEYR